MFPLPAVLSGPRCSVNPKASIFSNTKLALPPRISRVNGCSPPRNAFQAVSWTVFLTLSLAIFGIFIPFLPHAWKHSAYVVAEGIFFFHLVFHLSTCCIDPADPNVRLKDYSQPMPIFDRSQHAHVIQNRYCNLTKKAKHCITCNKCVSGLDHHCKWLNNCVGSRNYWFFSTVASAVAGLLCVIAILLYVLIQYFVRPWVLRTDPRYEAAGRVTCPVPPSPFLEVKKMTTLDYLTQTREKEERSKCQAERKDPSVQIGEGLLQVPPVSLLHLSRPGTMSKLLCGWELSATLLRFSAGVARGFCSKRRRDALGSSARGVKAKKSLLRPNCLCHLSGSRTPRRGLVGTGKAQHGCRL
nr:probable palmitoyltransferase ZDHHC11 [Aotus nancymaae]